MRNMNNVPNDLGLLPETFVMPTGNRIPSLFKEPQRRAKLEWARIRKRVSDYASVLSYKWAVVRRASGLQRPMLKLKETKTIARELHHEMYSAFAEGDVHALQKTCTSGLFNTFLKRVNARSKDTKLEWTVERYIGQPKVVSHRVAVLPDPPMSAIRQAVVRLRSMQKLEKFKVRREKKGPKKGEETLVPEGNAVPQEFDEYVVVQKLMFRGKESPWMVWGSIQESEPDDLLKKP